MSINTKNNLNNSHILFPTIEPNKFPHHCRKENKKKERLNIIKNKYNNNIHL